MQRFFRSIFCCSSNGVSSPQVVSSSSNTRNSTNRNRNSSSNRTQQQSTTAAHERRRHSNNVKPQKKFLKLKSMFPTENIQCSDIRSDEMKDLRYNCPICFRYFNHILISTCCKNYMCHFCANDLNDRVKKDDKVIVARCPFCDSEDFELHDVDPTEKPKKYTDSFYSTVKSNGKGAIFGGEQFQFNSTKNKGQMYASHMPKKRDFMDLPVEGLRDQRAASDGAVYMHKEMEKMSNTYNFQNHEGFDEYGSPLRANLTNIIAAARSDNNTHDDIHRRSFITNEEKKSDIDDSEDDDLNDRDQSAPLDKFASPNRIADHYGDIEVIKEDEFEMSMVPPQTYENDHENAIANAF